VFDDPEAAEKAIKEVQGFNLFEKPMVLQYAKTRSDATVKSEGTETEFEAHKRKRLAEKGMICVVMITYYTHCMYCVVNCMILDGLEI